MSASEEGSIMGMIKDRLDPQCLRCMGKGHLGSGLTFRFCPDCVGDKQKPGRLRVPSDPEWKDEDIPF